MTNPELEEGYLPLLDVGESVLLGNAAVPVENGSCFVMAINTGDKDVEVEVEPQELLPYDIYHDANSDEDGILEEALKPSLPSLSKTERVRIILEKIGANKLERPRRKRVIKLVKKFPYLFYLPGDDFPGTTLTTHHIPTIDDLPLSTKQYRYPPVHKEEIRKQISKLLELGVISPSTSPYNSPLWIVPKKADARGNRQWRMVIDFRALNAKTVGDAYPLPNITEILDRVGGAKFFSVFDLAAGFHQIPMDPRDRPKTAFSTDNGHYEYLRMPFGLKGAPATFQRLMDRVLIGLQGVELFVYLDDIVIYASSYDEHDKKANRLFNRLSEAGLKLQPEKCAFLSTQVAYLGHVISEDGVKPSPGKIESVRNFPVPRTQKNVREFLGLVGYYRRFIPDFATRTKPLTELLKKGKRSDWTARHQTSFEDMRDALCHEPVLQCPRLDEPFILTTDASDYAIGAVLSQGKIGEDRPVSYASRIMNSAEKNYTATEKECLAIVEYIKYFRHYLYGQKFTVVTDHQALTWLHTTKDIGSRLMRWRLRLLEYEYDIKYKPGKTNKNADALSRKPVVEANEKKTFVITLNPKKRGRPRKLKPGTPVPDPTPSLPVSELSEGACPESSTSGIGDRVRERRRAGGSQAPPTKYNLPRVSKMHGSKRKTYDYSSSDDSAEESITFQSGFKRRTVRFDDDDEYLPPQLYSDSSSSPRKNQEPLPHEGAQCAEGSDLDLDETLTNSPVVMLPPTGDVSDSDSDTELAITGELNETIIRMDESNESQHSPLPLSSSTPLKTPSMVTPIMGAGSRDTASAAADSSPIIHPPLAKRYAEGESRIVGLYETIPPTVRQVSSELLVPKPTNSGTPTTDKLIIKESRDSLLMARDNYLHFISADCSLYSPIGLSLSELGFVDPDRLRALKPKKGQVIVSQTGSIKTFTVICKDRFCEQSTAKDVFTSLRALQVAVENTQTDSIRVSRVNDRLDALPAGFIRNAIREIFVGQSVTFTICSGEVQTPPPAERGNVIREFHSSLTGGHKGVTKTYRRVRERFYWSDMRRDIQDFIRACQSCQLQKLVRIKTRQPMIITDTPTDAFDKVSLDLVGPLPTTPSGNKYVLTVQDQLTKLCVGVPIPSKRASVVSDAFAQSVIARFGCPRAILTDCGKEFVNSLLSNLAKLFKIKQITTSAYHPQSNGALERSHQVLADYLKHYVENYEDWDRLIPFAMFSYNTSVHEGTKFTPHELVYGKPARIPSSFPSGEQIETYGSYLIDLVTHIDQIRAMATTNLNNAKVRSKRYHDRNLNEKSFKVGDIVYTLRETDKHKFASNYLGPYEIVELLDKNNVILESKEGKRILKHMDKLKHAHFSEEADSDSETDFELE